MNNATQYRVHNNTIIICIGLSNVTNVCDTGDAPLQVDDEEAGAQEDGDA